MTADLIDLDRLRQQARTADTPCPGCCRPLPKGAGPGLHDCPDCGRPYLAWYQGATLKARRLNPCELARLIGIEAHADTLPVDPIELARHVAERRRPARIWITAEPPPAYRPPLPAASALFVLLGVCLLCATAGIVIAEISGLPIWR